jgi:BirA family transcriptional regulator, biotin operon repressor / biotin---[acetyl-CoA-carboxylase] ligase
MKLDAEKINAAIGPDDRTWQITVQDEVSSTSDFMRELGKKGGPEGLVVFAEFQTKGRGRREKTWEALPGRDLMFSILLRPKTEPVRWARLTTLAALAICKGVTNELPVSPLIKWPNDIYIEGKKVCGILAETLSSPSGSFVVLGIGINVNSLDFSPEIKEMATSLSLMTDGGKRSLDRNLLAGAILTSLDREFSRISDDKFPNAMEEVRALSWLIGRTIRGVANGAGFYGRVTDLDSEGHLIVILSDGTKAVLSSAENIREVI